MSFNFLLCEINQWQRKELIESIANILIHSFHISSNLLEMKRQTFDLDVRKFHKASLYHSNPSWHQGTLWRQSHVWCKAARCSRSAPSSPLQVSPSLKSAAREVPLNYAAENYTKVPLTHPAMMRPCQIWDELKQRRCIYWLLGCRYMCIWRVENIFHQYIATLGWPLLLTEDRRYEKSDGWGFEPCLGCCCCGNV